MKILPRISPVELESCPIKSEFVPNMSFKFLPY